MIPKIKYLGDSICAAVSDRGIIYYEGKEIPEEIVTVEEVKEIQSIFFGSDTVGLVTEGREEAEGEEGARYSVCLYNALGNQVLNQGTNLSYNQAKISGGDLILFNENECEIYSEQGVLRYAGSFDGTIMDIYKSSGLRKYIFVFSDRTEEVKLK